MAHGQFACFPSCSGALPYMIHHISLIRYHKPYGRPLVDLCITKDVHTAKGILQ